MLFRSAWAEYCYNTSYHSALRATPFEVVYGRPPPPILPVDPDTARTEAAGDLLRSQDEMLAEVRQRLVQAQQLAKHYYDGHHREAEFAVGDWVWLRLLHRTTQSLNPRQAQAGTSLRRSLWCAGACRLARVPSLADGWLSHS